jgi:parallel beta-helix repeat protein
MILDSGAGIDISYSDNNVISHNYVLNKGFGICIGGSNNNNVLFNTLYKNSMGIGIENGFNNKVYKNSISFCKGNGISIYSGSGNLIVGNTVAQNQIGIQIGISTFKLVSPCTLNVITKNNLINNQRDAFVICHYIPLPNFWIHNYWNSWRLPIPRPIPGVIEGFFGLLLFFPWVQFDWMPRLFPYGGEE